MWVTSILHCICLKFSLQTGFVKIEFSSPYLSKESLKALENLFRWIYVIYSKGQNSADLSFIILAFSKKPKLAILSLFFPSKIAKSPMQSVQLFCWTFWWVWICSISLHFPFDISKRIQSEAIRSVCLIKTLIRWSFPLKIRFYNPKDFSPAKKWFLFIEKLLFSFDGKIVPLCWKERLFRCQVTRWIQNINSDNANNLYLRLRVVSFPVWGV